MATTITVPPRPPSIEARQSKEASRWLWGNHNRERYMDGRLVWPGWGMWAHWQPLQPRALGPLPSLGRQLARHPPCVPPSSCTPRAPHLLSDIILHLQHLQQLHLHQLQLATHGLLSSLMLLPNLSLLTFPPSHKTLKLSCDILKWDILGKIWELWIKNSWTVWTGPFLHNLTKLLVLDFPLELQNPKPQKISGIPGKPPEKSTICFLHYILKYNSILRALRWMVCNFGQQVKKFDRKY